MKKRLLAILCTVPVLAYATDEVPLPKQGLQIVPLSAMSIPEDMKKDIINKKNEEKEKGYQESDDEYASYLLNVNKNASREIQAFSAKAIADNDPLDTHLKNNISDISLVFSFDEISWTSQQNIIGYAAIGSYIKEKTKGKKNGWTGVKVFFSDPILGGTCAYSFFNLKASHGAVQLSKETTEYLVHNKPSTKMIEGNHHLGFVYTLDWYGAGTMNLLECANATFNKEIMYKMIMLANKIDR